MGLSTRQVSSDELDWGDQNFLQSGGLELPKPPPTRRQSQNQQLDPLPCPRCGSKNTKFCYYNNYNKSQPRHFCKACKRHWTKGGTLRNVPVGGGRKNKRLKTAAAAATTTTSGNVKSSTAGINNPIMGNQSHHQTQSLSLALGDQKDIFGILSQASINNRGNNVNCNFLCPSTTLPLIQNQMPPFTFSTLSSLETNPSSISPPFQFLNGDNLVGLASVEDTITLMPSTSTFVSQTWQAPLTSSGMEVPNYWNWDEVDPLVSTDQLNIPWDDTEVKP